MQHQQQQLVISDAFARTLATYWQDLYDPLAPVTVLACSGAVTPEIERALRHDLAVLERATANVDTAAPVVAQAQLGALLAYVQLSGPRGPATGWADLPDSEASSRTFPELHWPSPATTQPALPSGPVAGNGHAGSPTPSTSARDNLYELLGGGRAVADLVETFYRSVLADPSLAHYFCGIDVHRVKAHQYAFITAVTGGPEYYVGRSIRKTHASLGISARDYARMIEHLADSLAGVGADQRVIEALVGRIDPLRDDVVSPG